MKPRKSPEALKCNCFAVKVTARDYCTEINHGGGPYPQPQGGRAAAVTPALQGITPPADENNHLDLFRSKPWRHGAWVGLAF